MTSLVLEQRCAHFGECGGCQSQDVSYATQLELKAAALEELFAAYWSKPIPITPSPIIAHYRNKVDFTFAPMQYETPPPPDFVRETVLGFNKPGRWYWPLDISACLIGPEGNGALLGAVQRWAKERDYKAFNQRRLDEGFLRVLLLREGKRTGDHLVMLITSEAAFDTDSFVAVVQGAYPGASVYWGIHRHVGQVATAEEVHHLAGPEAITERLCFKDDLLDHDFQYRVSPFSFFQTNTLATERLYGIIRNWVREASPSLLYDLYGGMGSIAFTCADLVKEIISVESVPEASADGRYNAGVNGIENVSFITARVKNHLIDVLANGGMGADTMAIADPPRSGMVPKAIRRLIESAPREIVYVACQPKVFVQELPQFLEHYELIDLQAVDLFPHTRHVEALARLRRNKRHID